MAKLDNPYEHKRLKNSPAERPSAVIITGNPKYITGNPKAEELYSKLTQHLAGLGYSVKLDPGKAHTEPPKADLWVGHSRGADRLRFAPKGTRTVAIGSADGINHPDDDLAEVPNDAHYQLTPQMLEKISAAPRDPNAKWLFGVAQ